MFENLYESIRVSENIARHLGIQTLINTIYIDKSFTLAEKIKNALHIIPNTLYTVDIVLNKNVLMNRMQEKTYDIIMLNESIDLPDNVSIYCPLLYIPENVFELSKWKLAYTLDDLITEQLHTQNFSPCKSYLEIR